LFQVNIKAATSGNSGSAARRTGCLGEYH